jgi:signal transduction histidine kinase
MTIGILLVDKHSELTYVDPFACRLLGCSDEINLRESWDRIRSSLGLSDLMSCPDKGHAQTLNSGADHSSLLQVRMSPINNSSFDGYVVHLKDSTVNDILSLQLLTASQVRNQNYINSALIHDLRAPLNAMEIHLELLAENVSDRRYSFSTAEPEARRRQAIKGVGILKEELARLNRTLRTLLGIGRPLNMAFTRFDLMLALHELVILLTPKARQQRVEIQFDYSGRQVFINGNRDYLKQAFLNVAINALEAMPEGGNLAISVARDEDQVEVVFQDQGPGIAEEFLKQIYNLHFTTKADGSGMGLFAAQLVVADAHGGSVEVANDEEGGARVTCRLPTRRLYPSNDARH